MANPCIAKIGLMRKPILIVLLFHSYQARGYVGGELRDTEREALVVRRIHQVIPLRSQLRSSLITTFGGEKQPQHCSYSEPNQKTSHKTS